MYRVALVVEYLGCKVVPDTYFLGGDTDTETVSRLVDSSKVSLLSKM